MESCVKGFGGKTSTYRTKVLPVLEREACMWGLIVSHLHTGKKWVLGTALNLFCKSGMELRNAFRECVVCFGSVFIMCSNPATIFILNIFFSPKKTVQVLLFFFFLSCSAEIILIQSFNCNAKLYSNGVTSTSLCVIWFLSFLVL